MTVFYKLLNLTFQNRCRKMSLIFTQKLNPMLGVNSWEWQDEDYDYHQEIARSSYADMLHDTERNQKYNDALKLAIDKMHSMGKKAKVLDIGTGTGLLSMMAVKCGADSVIACEAFAPMSDCAKKIIDLNEFGDKIKVVPKRSTELVIGENGDLSERANILVTEVFDTELIGEGALTTFSHAHKELLERDCIVVPNSGTIYVQVVESPLAQNWNKLKDFCGDSGEILIKIPPIIKNCAGAAAVHDIQLSQLPITSFKQIVSPQAVFHFDWSGKTPLKFDNIKVLKLKAESNGTAQIVFMWWDLQMDPENKIILSCAPYWAHPLKQNNPDLTTNDIPWRDHWMQALYYLPKEINLQRGDDINLISCHDEFSLWFHLDVEGKTECPTFRPICDCSLHIGHSRTRIGQINDETKNKKYVSLINQYVNEESVVLLLGDGFYLGLAAAKRGAKKVLYLDDNYLSTRVMNEFIKSNDLSNVEIVESVEALKNNENVKDITLVFGQPHFLSTILPWDNLLFGYLIHQIQDVLPKTALIMPKVAKIQAMIVEFKDLQKIRAPLEAIGEFDMKPFDLLMMDSTFKCDDYVEPQPLWEYPCIARSSVKEMTKIDIENLFSINTTKVSDSIVIPSEDSGKYNGVAIWIDWDFTGNEENIITTGPIVPPIIGEVVQWDMYTRQGVRFLHSKNKNTIFYTLYFSVAEGKMEFQFC